MVLDKEEHRALLLQILDAATFGGALRKQVYELGKAIEEAKVEPPRGEATAD